MNHQDTISPTLFNLIAREWTTGASVTAMLYNARQTAVAFALDNGTVAIADVSDEDPPQHRIHISAENGRSTIRPRLKAAKPLEVIEVESGGNLVLGAMGGTDFVACSQTCPIHRLSPNGDKELMDLGLTGSVAAFDHCLTTGQFSCAGGTGIEVFDENAKAPALRLDHGEPIGAIGFSPDGQSIAVTHDCGLTIWSLQPDDLNRKDVAFTGRPGAVNWSPDGQWIATPLADGGFQLTRVDNGNTGAVTDYPAPANSIAWNRQANALITSGAFRVAAWSMDDPPLKDPKSGALETGRVGLVSVSAVSSHPDRNLAVAGYNNGFIAIVQIAGRDELVLNSEDHGAVTNLVWSRDGKHIAVATDRSRAAIVTLPPQMFK